MADLPDLDPNNIGFLGYYNVLDNGDTSDSNWNPEDVLTYSLTDPDVSVSTYTIYDNGVEGELNNYPNATAYIDGTSSPSSAETENVNFRAKSDGWVLVYTKPRSDAMLTGTQYDDGSTNPAIGKYNAFGVNSGVDSSSIPIISTFDGLLGETSASSVSGNISWYDYDQTDATNWSSAIPNNNNSDNMSFSYTDTTSIYSLFVNCGLSHNITIGGSNSLSFADYFNTSGYGSCSVDLANPDDATGITLETETQPNTEHKILETYYPTKNYFSLWG